MSEPLEPLDQPLSPERFAELLARPRKDLEEALERGCEEMRRARAEAPMPYLDMNLRFR